MTWWLLLAPVAGAVVWGLRRPRVQSWTIGRVLLHRCPYCNATVRVDSNDCPSCYAKLGGDLGSRLRRDDMRRFQREHEAFVDEYVAAAGGRDAVAARVQERMRQAGTDMALEEADAAIDLWRVEWMKPFAFDPFLENLVRRAARDRRIEFCWLSIFTYAFAWFGIAYGLACADIGAYKKSDGGFDFASHGTSGSIWVELSFALALPVAGAATWLLLKAKSNGLWEWE